MTTPLSLLTSLLRFDTTNPPGDEAACLRFLQETLASVGIAGELIGADPARPNLVARVAGRGAAPPLLLQGHVDVVPTAGQQWTYPPFAAEIHDGYLYGRGALDMKSGVAMMTVALMRLVADGIQPAGDVILCLMADEEKGGELGARWLVENRPALFDGVRYGIGEFGGFPFYIGRRKFYPIQVAERVGCELDVRITGPGGHGALGVKGGAPAKLGRVLTKLERRGLPYRITPATRMMVEGFANGLGPPLRHIMRSLLDPRLGPLTLRLLGERMATLAPLFRNTAAPTIIQGGTARNVVPSGIALTLDGRMLPGVAPEQMVTEVRRLLGEDAAEIRVVASGVPQPPEPDMGLFPLLADVLKAQDPTGIPVPFLLPAVTDGRWFSKLGIQHYGYLPLDLPPDLSLTGLAHAADERIPVGAVEFGTRALRTVLERYR